MPPRKTIQDVIVLEEELRFKTLTKVFKSTKDKLDVQCIDCGFVWHPTYDNLARHRSSCPECAKDKRKQTWIGKYGVDNPQKAKSVREKTEQTFLDRHGVKYPYQNPDILAKSQATCEENHGVKVPCKSPEIARKAMTNLTKSTTLQHWLTNSDLVCVGSYEIAVVNYFNANQINFHWQHETFTMPDGRTYRPDAYLMNENKWIEIKGYFRKDAEEKWDWFHSQHKNSELWTEEVLKQKGIL